MGLELEPPAACNLHKFLNCATLTRTIHPTLAALGHPISPKSYLKHAQRRTHSITMWGSREHQLCGLPKDPQRPPLSARQEAPPLGGPQKGSRTTSSYLRQGPLQSEQIEPQGVLLVEVEGLAPAAAALPAARPVSLCLQQQHNQ